jgi:hypothetical protein
MKTRVPRRQKLPEGVHAVLVWRSSEPNGSGIALDGAAF